MRRGVFKGSLEEQRDSLAQLVRACGAAKDLCECKRIHAHIRDSGHHSQDRYLANLLVQMYGKCGSLEDARRTFEEIILPNQVSWSIMMAAYAQNGHLEEAKRTLDKMPNPNMASWNTMLAVYAQNGYLEEAESLFGRMSDRDVISWNAMVAAYAQNGHLEEAKGTFDKMPTRNVVSWNTLVAVYVQNGRVPEGQSACNRMPEVNVVTWNTMVTGYAQIGELDNAKQIFEVVPERNVVSWNAIVYAYIQNGNLQEAKCAFDQMPERNMLSWNAMLGMCAQSRYLLEVKSIFDRMCKHNLASWNAMLTAYADNGHMDEAKIIFDEMPEQNIISWNAMVHAYAHNGHLALSKGMFEAMPERDVVSWNAMVAAYVENGQLKDAKSTLDKMPECNIASWNSMVAAYAQCGELGNARSMFDEMPEHDVISWTTMVEAYAHTGFAKDAIGLFQIMVLEGVKPDGVSFLSILIACNHSGILHRDWFIAMSADHGIKPIAEHYCCMVDILARSGHLYDAEELIDNMPIPPNAVAWGALLGACSIYRDVERAARAAKHVIELEPEDATPFVVLANIYAAANRHQEATFVRNALKERGVRRQPGISSIEVENKVHKFIVGNTTHPQIEAIWAELERLSKLMQEAGFVDDTKEVLHDVSIEEKQQLLCHHSEKLAIAFGLMSTAPGTTLRIVNNLRVCSNCHTAIKLISKIVGRPILVRDSNRFHHFQQGACSCGDYW